MPCSTLHESRIRPCAQQEREGACRAVLNAARESRIRPCVTTPPRAHLLLMSPRFLCRCPHCPPILFLYLKPRLLSQSVLRGSCEPVFPAPGPSTEAAPRPPSQQLEGQMGASGFIMTGRPWLPGPTAEEPPSLPGGMDPVPWSPVSSLWVTPPFGGHSLSGGPGNMGSHHACVWGPPTLRRPSSAPTPLACLLLGGPAACPLVEQLAACSEGVCAKWVTFVSKNGFVSSSPFNNLAKERILEQMNFLQYSEGTASPPSWWCHREPEAFVQDCCPSLSVGNHPIISSS